MSEPKPAKDMNKDDWKDVIRANQWETDYKIQSVSKFLGKEPRYLTKLFKVYKGRFYKCSIAYVLEEFLALKGYKVIERSNVYEAGYEPLQTEDIEVKPRKYKRCMTDGSLFLEHTNHKFVLDLEDHHYRDDSWYVTFFYDSQNAGDVKNFIEELEQYAREKSYLHKSKIDPALNHITLDTEYTWDDVILPENIKKEIRMNVDSLINNVDIYKKNNTTFKRGIILKGVPGTGKTLVGKVLCKSADSTFIWVTPKFLTNPGHIDSICTLARELAPSILFFEDIDLYAGDREANFNNSLLGELMNQLDGLIENEYVIVIATTNKVDTVEEALRNRPGRFDRIIDVPKPDEECRLRMLKLYTNKYKQQEGGLDLQDLAKRTDGFTGAHMKELVNTAIITAIDEGSFDGNKVVLLTQEHFSKNIQKVKTKKIEVMGFKTNRGDMPLDPDDF